MANPVRPAPLLLLCLLCLCATNMAFLVLPQDVHEDDALLRNAAAEDDDSMIPSLIMLRGVDAAAQQEEDVNDDRSDSEDDDEDLLDMQDGAGLSEAVGAAERGWRCKSGKCRRKCNKKGKNGACVGPVCVCWK